MPSKKINNLESLRGFAALMVALFHFQIGDFLTGNSLIKHGSLGVEFFFVLSGFVIAENYLSKLNNFNELIKFQIKRFWRLYPLHIFVLLLWVIVEFIKLFILNYSSINPSVEAFKGLKSIGNLVESIFLVQAIFEDDYVWNNVAWSLSTEFYTYIFFAITVFIFKRISLLIFLIIVVVHYSNILEFYFLREIFSNQFLNCINLFCMGVLTNYFYTKFKLLNIKTFEVISWALLFLTIFAISNKNQSFGIINFNIKNIYIIFAFLIFFSSTVKNTSVYSKFLNVNFIQYLGKISYSLYMIHTLIVFFIKQIMRFVLKFDMIYSDGIAGRFKLEIVQSNIAVVIYLFLCFMMSHLLYQFIENRYRVR